MKESKICECCYLQTHCINCKRLVIEKILCVAYQWIRIKESAPPPMETVLLCVGGKVIPGWNESVQTEEDPVYCSWERWPEPFINGEGVTHWMPLPKNPEDKNEIN